MRKLKTLLGIAVMLLPHLILRAGTITTNYEYEGKHPFIATKVTTIEKETGRLLMEGLLTEIKAEERLLVTEEDRYAYVRTEDEIIQYQYHYKVERSLDWGKVVREEAYYQVPVPGVYVTSYDYENSKAPYLPSSSITRNDSTGEIVSKSRVVKIVPEEDNQSWLEIEETHFDGEKVVFRSLVKRGVSLGQIISEKPTVGKRLTDYTAWWPTSEWPCGRRF